MRLIKGDTRSSDYSSDNGDHQVDCIAQGAYEDTFSLPPGLEL